MGNTFLILHLESRSYVKECLQSLWGSSHRLYPL